MSLYRDNPSRGHSTDLQEYFDSPAAHSGQLNAYSSNIPMASRNYGAQPDAMNSSTRMNQYSDNDRLYSAPVAQHNAWLEKGNEQSSGKAKWVVAAAALGLLALVAVGVAVGVTLAKKHSTSSSSSSSSGSSNDTVTGDPSVFNKDSSLFHSFYGMAYTPVGSQYPECGNSLEGVIKDIQIMSQLTSRVRLYGSDCNQTSLVLDAIAQTKVNMTVYVANYPIATDSGAAYDRQKSEMKTALEALGFDHVAGVTVGNEFILDYLDDNDATDPNSATGNTGAELLISYINDTRSMLSGMGATVKVGNADAGAYFNDLVVQSIDYGMANVHPWFANVSIDQAAGWTWEFFEDTDVALAQQYSPSPQMSIAETGWPTKSSDAGNESNGPSIASVANLNTFLNTFICDANTNGTEYFFFEFYDEEWKDEQFGGVEGWWGLFNANLTLKDGLTIPNCEID